MTDPSARPKPVAKRCPKCNLPSPATAAKCRCGHEFFEGATTTAVPPPILAAAVTVGAPVSPIIKALGLEGVGPMTPSKAAGGLVGGLSGLGGALVGLYAGLNLVIPAGAAFGIAALAKKTGIITGPAKHFVDAVAAQAGHMVWFILGLLVAGAAALGQVAFDVVFMTAGLWWLMTRPGPWPVRALLGWQGLAVLVNVILLVAARPGSQEHRALVAHLAMRAAAIYFLVTGLKELQKEGPVTAPQVSSAALRSPASS